jgi:ribosomal protein S18 acetylase RimI-like enzyme
VTNLHPAIKSDAPILAQISLLAAGGTFELLLKGLKRGVTPEMVLTALCSASDTEYSYNFYEVAEVDGKIAGGINYISVEDRYKLAPNINPLLQKEFKFGWWQLVKFLRRARHLRGMNEIKAPKNSLHINDIAVFPKYQGLGIGQQLVNFVIEEARKRHFSYVSLYVWADNISAIRFYEKLGFKIEKTAEVRPHRYLPHTGSHLMLYKIA